MTQVQETKELRIRRLSMQEDLRQAGCPGCDGPLSLITKGRERGLFRCEHCGGLVGVVRRVRLASAHTPVIMDYARNPDDLTGRSVYFDLTVIDERGATDRVHGWYDPQSRRVVQFG